MDTARRGYVGVAVVIAAMVFFVWADSVPVLRVPVGVAMIVLAILWWVTPVVRPRAPGTPDVPFWNKVGVSVGTALFGVSKLLSEPHLATLAVFCMFVPQVPQMIRQYRGTDDDSVSER